ncbi:MAG: PLP-dependent transferase [Eubacteriaceae bacterium]|nr:PLP-dependent transferase [Eubacteriaceae bacterium]
MKIESQLVHGTTKCDPLTGAISIPIYQSATFIHPGPNETTGYDYSRLLNPTREELEKSIAVLEGGLKGFAFSSGMAAISTVTELFSTGDHIIVSDDLYGGTYRLFEEIVSRHGITFTYTDTTDPDNLITALEKNTKAIFIETPSNPMMKVTDIRKIAAFAKKNNLITIADNTFMTPYYQQPLKLGADIVIHSGTKYLGGHNDTLAGLLVTNRADLAEDLTLIQKSIGAVLSPFDSWLLIRGMKTLAVRLEKQEISANKIAHWLEGHNLVEKVFYVGLKTHPGYEVNKIQSKGFGGMISFSVKSGVLAECILKNVKLISFAESLGGVETLITYPLAQTHSAIPEEIRNRLGVDERLLRLSIGIEDVDDLIEDLDKAIIEI